MSALPDTLTEQAQRTGQIARMSAKSKQAFTLIIDGYEVPVLSGRVSRSIDTVVDGWTAEIAWVPGQDKRLDPLVAPFAYPKAQVYLGQTLVNTGRLYDVTNNVTATGITKTLEGASYTADLVDSMIDPGVGPSGECNNLSVWNICHALMDPLGLGVKTDLNDVVVATPNIAGGKVRVASPFQIVDIGMTETYAELFTRLAFQRGMLVTNDEYGNLFLTNAHTTGVPVATLGEGNVQDYLKAQSASGNVRSPSWAAKFDGRKRFYKYTVYCWSGMGDGYESTAQDNYMPINSQAVDTSIPKTRRTHVLAGDNEIGGAQISAQYKRSMQLAEALTIPFPVTTWYDGHGKLWTPNTLVRVQAPSIHIPNGFTFLIRQVEYTHEGSGQTATLSILPPQVYTGEAIKEPWAKGGGV